MEQQIKKAFVLAQEYWKKQSKKAKSYIIITMIGVLIFSVGVPLLLRWNTELKYSVLYQGLSTQEQGEIYLVLSELDIPATTSTSGELMVLSRDVNRIKLQLSSMGYPKTALSYSVFTSNAGFMATELEKKQYLVIDLQTRLEETLRQIEGVRSAIVTLNIPNESNYVWQTNQDLGSASVLLDLSATNTLDTKMVLGIKNLVASSVPQMDSSRVIVVDASSGAELAAQSVENNMDSSFLQIQFEKEIETKMVEKVLNLLTMPYGYENIRVSASVVIDYDKMLSEEMEYIPFEEGKGVIQSLEEWYANGGGSTGSTTGGVAGEDSNTDVPTYQGSDDETPSGEQSYSAEYLVSYIKRQIEKNNAQLKSATLSVVINNQALNQVEIGDWVKTIAKAVNVAETDVIVHSVSTEKLDTPIIDTENLDPLILYGIIGGSGLLVLILIIVVILSINKRRKNRKAEAEIDEKLQNEIKQRSKPIVPGSANDPSLATLENIQNFTQENPEITANLIREMLKEDE
jgi:flagellar M-ring protein FliF